MIRVFKTNEKTNETIGLENIPPKCWIHLTNPNEEEIKRILVVTKLDETLFRTTLDISETAHIDFEEDTTMIVFDTPVTEASGEYNRYTTIPFGILFNKDYFVTVCSMEDTIDISQRGMKTFNTGYHLKLSIQLMYRNAASFVTHLRKLDKLKEETEQKLRVSMHNRELFDLLNIGKSLVYLSTGLNANNLVMEKFKRLEIMKTYPADLELLEDAIIENRQASEMCNIHRETLSGTLDTFASVISNNVNYVMRILTVATIVLAIPTLVASFFGMNVPVPLANNILAFLIIITISAVLGVIISIMLLRYTNNRVRGGKD